MGCEKRTTGRALRLRVGEAPLVVQAPLDSPIILSVLRVAAQMRRRGHSFGKSVLATVGVGTDDDEPAPDHLRLAGAVGHGLYASRFFASMATTAETAHGTAANSVGRGHSDQDAHHATET